MGDEIPSIGPSVELVMKRALILKQHVDDVLEIRERHARCRTEMIGHEVRVMVFDGFSPRLAEQAAMNNLGVRLRDLDLELEAALTRMQEELRQRMLRLQEEAEDLGEQAHRDDQTRRSRD